MLGRKGLTQELGKLYRGQDQRDLVPPAVKKTGNTMRHSAIKEN